MSETSKRWRWLAKVSIVLLAALVLLAWLMIWWLSPAPITGRLVEYHSGAPIADATVTLRRQGWGRSDQHGQLIWDKAYVATTTTDDAGRFRVPMPGPMWLVGTGGGRLKAEAEGYQTLDVGHANAAPGADLTLQTVANRDERLPGGTAYLGWDSTGKPFGWSFLDDAPDHDLSRVDLFALELQRDPLGVTLAVTEGGGLHFVPAEAQGIFTPSYDYLLRYQDVSPEPPSASRLTLDDTPGTLFLRTPQGRHAKLAWEPEAAMAMSGSVPGLDIDSERLLSLRFVYRPGPGNAVVYQPPLFPVEPVRAALLATLPERGVPDSGPRAYRLVVTDAEGRELERQRVELTPGVPLDLESCAEEAPLTWRFESLELTFDEQDLPRVSLTLNSERSVHHSLPTLVGPRDDTLLEVTTYDTDYQRHDLVVHLRELPDNAERAGCLPPG